jgi:hypothetical protein
MGYSSELAGHLTVQPRPSSGKHTYSPEFLRLAAEEGLQLPQERTGLSKGALQKLRDHEDLRYFFIPKPNGIHCSGNEGDLGEEPETGLFAELITLIQQGGMELEGTLYRSGEGTGDVSRYIFTPGAAEPLCEDAQLTWPDGAVVTEI